MVNRIIETCFRNRFMVILLSAGAIAAGFWAMRHVNLDAIPDLSDTQVIVYARWDRSPDILEDQVTYPIISSMLGAPRVKSIRGFSDFGYAFIYVVFEDGTDIYWARSRTLEYLNNILSRLPREVTVELAKDITALGWVFQYALVDKSGTHDLAELRALQDWHLRFALQSVPGVAEVAPIGGFVRQYQVNLDPRALQASSISIEQVVSAVRRGNNDVGGRLIEFSGREYMVRGRGYVQSPSDIENIVLRSGAPGSSPLLIRHVGRVTLGPDLRRGIAEFDGEGQTVGAIVIMRSGENAQAVIERVRSKIEELRPGLPAGVEIVTTYDRGELIEASVATLTDAIQQELFVVSLVIVVFLLHLASSFIPIVTITAAILLSFIPMFGLGITANIMSLGGMVIAIGSMVDASIVIVEQTHRTASRWSNAPPGTDFSDAVLSSAKQVAATSFFALLVIAVAFIPVFTLEAQEGRLFRPLALTKVFAVTAAAVLSITLVPALLTLFIRPQPFRLRPQFLARIINTLWVGRIFPEERHPITRLLMYLYAPIVRFSLRYRWIIVVAAVGVIAATAPIYWRLGSEFMPPLDEGVLLYMPSTLPGISIAEAERLLQLQDRIIRSFPEVQRVFGKAGRADTATDPAPLSMMETVVILKPRDQWPEIPQWYSSWAPGPVRGILGLIWPDRRSTEELVHGPGGLNEALTIPGVVNAWTMPIKARIDMLTTGIRTPVGIKILGQDLREIERIGAELERVLREVPGTASVFAERTGGGYFLDFDLKRDELARYGLTVDDAEMAVTSAIGGENVTSTIEGRERYSVNVRYLRGYRSSPESLARVLVSTPSGAHVPLAQLADLRLRSGPAMIRDEDGRLSGYVYVDVSNRDIGSFVTEAQATVGRRVSIPSGNSVVWSGQYEGMMRVRERMMVVVPITALLILLLMYVNTRSWAHTLLVVASLPFSAAGAIWLLYLLDYNTSTAVWVGMIAFLGVDAETSVFMLLYLDLAFKDRVAAGTMRTWDDLKAAVFEGSVRRLRPKAMTVAVDFIGLLPIMLATGAGADVTKRIAAPMVAGMLGSFTLELVVYPAVYAIWKWHTVVKRPAA